MDDVEAELKLGRNELIQLALLGSDYTDGVRGVGVVNGVEVVAFTPANGRLRLPVGARVARRRRGGGGGGSGDDTEELRRFKRATRRRGAAGARDGLAGVVEAYTRPVVDASDERCGGRGRTSTRSLLLSGEVWVGRGEGRRVVVACDAGVRRHALAGRRIFPFGDASPLTRRRASRAPSAPAAPRGRADGGARRRARQRRARARWRRRRRGGGRARAEEAAEARQEGFGRAEARAPPSCSSAASARG